MLEIAKGFESGHAEASISEEPGAVVPHAGICAGGGRVTALSTATAIEQWPFKPLVAGSSPAALTALYLGKNSFPTHTCGS